MSYFLCLLFGHTGDLRESGYHVCSRCGLHEYHSSRAVDPDVEQDYDRAGLLVRPFFRLYWWASYWRMKWTWKRNDDSDLPF